MQKRPAVRSIEARNAIVNANAGLVPFTIWQSRRRLLEEAECLGRDEAIQAGLAGLRRAAELWQPEIRKLSTYAVKAIRWAVRKAALNKRKAERRQIRTVPLSRARKIETLVSQSIATPDAREIILGVLRFLCPREKFILSRRFGFEGEPAEWDTIGEELGLSGERVRQIAAKARHKLRVLHREKLSLAVNDCKKYF